VTTLPTYFISNISSLEKATIKKQTTHSNPSQKMSCSLEAQNKLTFSNNYSKSACGTGHPRCKEAGFNGKTRSCNLF
jgi:hypothetical protein